MKKLTAPLLAALAMLCASPADAQFNANVKWQGTNGFQCMPYPCISVDTLDEVWAAVDVAAGDGCSFVGPAVYQSGTFPSEIWKRPRGNKPGKLAPCDPALITWPMAQQKGTSTLSCPTSSTLSGTNAPAMRRSSRAATPAAAARATVPAALAAFAP